MYLPAGEIISLGIFLVNEPRGSDFDQITFGSLLKLLIEEMKCILHSGISRWFVKTQTTARVAAHVFCEDTNHGRGL